MFSPNRPRPRGPAPFLKRRAPNTAQPRGPPFSPHKLRKTSHPARRERRRRAAAGRPLPSLSAGPQSAQNRGGQTRKDLVSGASSPDLHAFIGQPGAFARRPACTAGLFPQWRRAWPDSASQSLGPCPQTGCRRPSKKRASALSFFSVPAGLRKARGDGETAGERLPHSSSRHRAIRLSAV